MEKLENTTVVDKLGDALMDVINSAEKGDSVSFDILSEIKKRLVATKAINRQIF
ncbi:hypothetical protein G5716_14260 [Bacillus pacificus]|nr:hypothetical protein [Bacillus pacificus]HDR7790341.1 hypothetical protein [Bacillus paranthracis]